MNSLTLRGADFGSSFFRDEKLGTRLLNENGDFCEAGERLAVARSDGFFQGLSIVVVLEKNSLVPVFMRDQVDGCGDC